MKTYITVITLTVALTVAVFVIEGKWHLFEKMGLAGWKSLIPIYSEYLVFCKAWNGKMYLLSLATKVSASAFLTLAVNGFTVNLGFAFLGIACALGAMVIDATVLYRLAKSFGHGAGYTVGLVLAEPVFAMILGLEDNEYLAA